MPGFPSLIASRDTISAETFLTDLLSNTPSFFDIDFMVERFFDLYHVIRSCVVLEDGHRLIRGITKDWQKIASSFDSILEFLTTPEIEEYFPSKELYLALISLIKNTRNILHDRIYPDQKSTPDRSMLQSQALEIIKHYLFYPSLSPREATVKYTPPALDEVLHIKESLFITNPGLQRSVYYVNAFVTCPFLNQKRKTPSIIRTITHVAQESPDLFTYFIPRWGAPLIGTRGGEITLPSRKELYFFFHDWQFILDDFTLFNDLQKMRQLKNAWYGQRLGMHITAQDLSWLL